MKNNHKQVVLITGASKRLGRSIAITLAKNGFDIALHHYKSKTDAKKLAKDLKKKFETDAQTFQADLRNLKEIKDLINNVYEYYSRIDVLVNNAAIFQNANFAEITEKIWDDTLDTNLKSIFFLSQYVSEKMLAKRTGVIINIASLGGIKPFAKSIPYSVSKAGVIMLTKCLAKVLSPEIRVNAIAPGTIDFGLEKVNIEKNLLKSYPNPEEIAKLVLHIINDYKHITGQCIAIESGNILL